MAEALVDKDLDEDEELAALRLAALATLKTHRKQNVDGLSASDSLPISSIVSSSNAAESESNKIPFVQSDRNSYVPHPWRKPRRGGIFPKASQRSNLIIISPVSLDDAKESNDKSVSALILPQHKWCNSGNEDSLSPKALRRTGPTRFNRHGSDSESSDSDYENSDNDSASNETVLQDELPERLTHPPELKSETDDGTDRQRRLSFQHLEPKINSDALDKNEATTVYNCLKSSNPSYDYTDRCDGYTSVQNQNDGRLSWGQTIKSEYSDYNQYSCSHSFSTELLGSTRGLTNRQNSSSYSNGEAHIGEINKFIAQLPDNSAWQHAEKHSKESSISDNSSKYTSDRKSKDYSDNVNRSDTFTWEDNDKKEINASYVSRDTLYNITNPRTSVDKTDYSNSKSHLLSQNDLRLELKKRLQEYSSKNEDGMNKSSNSRIFGQSNWDRNVERNIYKNDRHSEDFSSSSYVNYENKSVSQRGRERFRISSERNAHASSSEIVEKRHEFNLNQDRSKQEYSSSYERSRHTYRFSEEQSRHNRSLSHEKRSSRSSSQDRVRHEHSSSREKSRYEQNSSPRRNRREHSFSSPRSKHEHSSSSKRSRRERSSSSKRSRCERSSSSKRSRHEHGSSSPKSRHKHSSSSPGSRCGRSSSSRSRHEHSSSSQRSRREHSSSSPRSSSPYRKSHESKSSPHRSRHSHSSSQERQGYRSGRETNKRERSSSREVKKHKRSWSQERKKPACSVSRDKSKYDNSPSQDKSKNELGASQGKNRHKNSFSQSKTNIKCSSDLDKTITEHNAVQNQNFSQGKSGQDHSTTGKNRQNFSLFENRSKHDHNISKQMSRHEYTKVQGDAKLKNVQEEVQQRTSKERTRQQYSGNKEKFREGHSRSPSYRSRRRYNSRHYSGSRSRSLSSSTSTSSSSSRSSKPKIRSVPSVIKSVPSKVTSSEKKDPISDSKCESRSTQLYILKSDASTLPKKGLDTIDHMKLQSSIKFGQMDSDMKTSASDSNKRVPVHMRLGAFPRKRVIQMTKDVEAAFVNSSSSDEETVNTKCKRQNFRIITDVHASKEGTGVEKKYSEKEKFDKRSADIFKEKSKKMKIQR